MRPSASRAPFERWRGARGLAVTLGAIALVQALSGTPFSIPSPLLLYVVAVAYAAYAGGFVPGFLGAGMAFAHALHALAEPGGLFVYSPESLKRLLLFALAAPALVGMVGVLRRRESRLAARALATASSARVDELLRDIDAIVWEADAQTWQITFVSQHAERMLGYPLSEWLEGPGFWKKLLHPEDYDRAVAECRAANAEGRDHEMEYRAVAADGAVVWLRDIVRVLPGPDGRAREMRGVMVDVTRAKREEAWKAGQRRVLERVAGDAPLEEVLDALVRSAEAQMPGALCSVLRMEGERLRVAAAPSLPAEYNRSVDGLAPGPAAGSCGTAAHRRERVVVEDIAADPLWADCRHLALPHGLRSCWSQPILSPSGAVLGTFAIYHRFPLRSTAEESELVDTAAHIAGIAIERRAAGDALRRSEARTRAILRAVPDLMFRIRRDGTYLDYAAREDELAWPPERFLEKRISEVSPELAELTMPSVEEVLETGRMQTIEYALPVRGETRHYETRIVPCGEDEVLAIARDVTEGRRAEAALRDTEAQLLQAQKMEAVGRLAGGVAHDFNNLLTAIMGHDDMMLASLGEKEPLREHAEQIGKAAARAAGLTRQLLAFSRKQVMQPRVLELNSIVSDMSAMLRRLIGEPIELTTDLDPTIGNIRADPGQIEQVLLNLAVNARDAMPEGGKLVIATDTAQLDEAYARRHVGARAGSFVRLTVTDTGVGMDEATRARVFEPFFTTKEKGQGTGLGLSTVYGIVKQSGGNIWVYTEPGRGAAFKVYFPVVEEAVAAASAPAPEAIPTGTETVLVAEDEAVVRELVKDVLEQHGYRVLEAGNGEEALGVAAAFPGRIHLLVTDVVMPGMGGRDLAAALRASRPDTRVLYMSGYTETAAQYFDLVDSGSHFIEKPFTPARLATKVAEIVGASVRSN